MAGSASVPVVEIRNGEKAKLVFTITASVASVVVALASIHGYFVVPGILRAASEEAAQSIEHHKNNGVHPGAATRLDLDAETRVLQAQIQNVDTKIENTAKNLDAVRATVENVEKLVMQLGR